MNTLSAVLAAQDSERRAILERARIAKGWQENVYRLEYALWQGMWVSYDKFFANANELATWYHETVEKQDISFAFKDLWMWDRDHPALITDIGPHLKRIQ